MCQLCENKEFTHKGLFIADCDVIEEIPSLVGIETIYIHNCKNIKFSDNKDIYQSINTLGVVDCESMIYIPQLDNLNLLDVDNCGVKELPKLKELTRLTLTNCKFKDIPNYENLEILYIENCHNIKEIPYLPKLQILDINNCNNLKTISNMKKLHKLAIQRCRNLYNYDSKYGWRRFAVSDDEDSDEYYDSNYDEDDYYRKPQQQNEWHFNLEQYYEDLEYDENLISGKCEGDALEFFSINIIKRWLKKVVIINKLTSLIPIITEIYYEPGCRGYYKSLKRFNHLKAISD